MYIAVVLLSLLVTTALARLRLRLLVALIFAGVVGGGLIGNGDAFRVSLARDRVQGAAQVVELRTVNAISRAPDLDPAAYVDPLSAPGLRVGSVLASEREFGFAVKPWRLSRLATAYPLVVDRVLRSTLAGRLRLRSGATVAGCAYGGKNFSLMSAGNRVLIVVGSGTLRVALCLATTPA